MSNGKFYSWTKIPKTKKPKKFKSPFQHGYYEGVEYGLKKANTSVKPSEDKTGKKRNLLKSSKYKKGFEEGRKNAVRTIKTQVIMPHEKENGKRTNVLDFTRTKGLKIK